MSCKLTSRFHEQRQAVLESDFQGLRLLAERCGWGCGWSTSSCLLSLLFHFVGWHGQKWLPLIICAINSFGCSSLFIIRHHFIISSKVLPVATWMYAVRRYPFAEFKQNARSSHDAQRLAAFVRKVLVHEIQQYLERAKRNWKLEDKLCTTWRFCWNWSWRLEYVPRLEALERGYVDKLSLLRSLQYDLQQAWCGFFEIFSSRFVGACARSWPRPNIVVNCHSLIVLCILMLCLLLTTKQTQQSNGRFKIFMLLGVNCYTV